MAVKVTGLFQSPQSNLIYESPILGLVPHLEYPGVLNLEVRIFPSGSSMPNGGIYYASIDQTQLSYPTGSDPYASLIYSLETHVITNLSGSSPINTQATFERFNPTEEVSYF
jgi:hypothetical protein